MNKKPIYNSVGDVVKNTSYDDMAERVESSDVRIGFIYVLIMVVLLIVATLISFFTCKTTKI